VTHPPARLRPPSPGPRLGRDPAALAALAAPACAADAATGSIPRRFRLDLAP